MRTKPGRVRPVATVYYYKRQGQTGTATAPPPHQQRQAAKRQHHRAQAGKRTTHHHPTAASRGRGALRPDVTGGDEGRIQTGPGRPVSPLCLHDLRPVHYRFALLICLLAVGFGAVAGEGYSEI